MLRACANWCRLTSWAVSDFWAPELHVINGVVRVYFVARDTTGLLCVGVATSTSSSPLGPYKYTSPRATRVRCVR